MTALLTDPELAAAIHASGATPDTYYYGHDYRGSDLVRFFALADRDHVALLRRSRTCAAWCATRQREQAGFGALISRPPRRPGRRHHAASCPRRDPASRAVARRVFHQPRLCQPMWPPSGSGS